MVSHWWFSLPQTVPKHLKCSLCICFFLFYYSCRDFQHQSCQHMFLLPTHRISAYKVINTNLMTDQKCCPLTQCCACLWIPGYTAAASASAWGVLHFPLGMGCSEPSHTQPIIFFPPNLCIQYVHAHTHTHTSLSLLGSVQMEISHPSFVVTIIIQMSLGLNRCCVCYLLSLSPHFSASLLVVRKLQEFELPYISISSLRNSEFHILLRKRYPPPAHIMTLNFITSFRVPFSICNYNCSSYS